MPREPTTPDGVELVRKQVEALDRRDLDGVMSDVTEDVVLDGRADFFEGRAAVRGFLDEWFRTYEELDFELEEVSYLGGGVVFAVVIQDGRLVGSAGHIRQREGWVYLCVGGLIARLTTSDVDEGRAAAERLAQERGQAVSQANVEVVRRVVAALNAHDLEGYLACCTEDVQLHTPVAAFSGAYEGREGIERFFTDIEDAAPDFHVDPQDFKTVGSDQVLAFIQIRSTGRASGIPMPMAATNVYDLIDGKISRLRVFLDHAEALKAVGLEDG